MALVTIVMVYGATQVKLFYGLPKLLPDSDSTYVQHQEFSKRFKTESTVFVIGLEENLFEDLKLFNAWYDLGRDISAIPGVDTVLSLSSVFNLHKNVETKQFDVSPVVVRRLRSQAELDSVSALITSLPFYKGLLYNDETKVSLMGISLNNELFNSENRGPLFDLVLAEVEKFDAAQNVNVRLSGLPYIRTVLTKLVKEELQMFILLTIAVMILILLLFFRSLKPVMVSMAVVCLGVVWSLGIMGWLGFEITILTSLIPPLVIVIGIPNCIFLINKYHNEFLEHGNQVKALTRVVQKIGKATFMTNMTTAVGFLTFIFTQSELLVEFGIVASINIMLLFVISLLMITISFSFLKPPKVRQLQHLEKGWVNKAVALLAYIVRNHRSPVYVVTILLAIAAFYGLTLIKTTGNLVDDLPEEHKVCRDLSFFEANFKGIMPFEISINTKKPEKAISSSTLKKIDGLQDLLSSYTEFSKPISIVEPIKFTKQAFYNGDPAKYSLINSQEKAFFKDYLENSNRDESLLDDYLDSTHQYTRVAVKMADVGTIEMDSLITELEPRIDSIFNPKRTRVDSLLGDIRKAESGRDTLLDKFFKRYPKYQKNVRRTYAKDSVFTAANSELATSLASGKERFGELYVEQDFMKRLNEAVDEGFIEIVLTGTSVVFLKGTNYLVKNLFISLGIAIVIVASIMAMFFSSFRMILVSIITNLFPLLLTAAAMGYFGIAIKPSTILVFSIAFGISVDDTIHFLAKYRQELKSHNWNISEAVHAALKETGVSMIYTSIILFFGFSVFDSSEFGGTQALGLLVSFTLLIAMLSNLVLLPSFLLTLEKSITTKAFKEPFFEILDEEEDIELDELTIRKENFGGNESENDVAGAGKEGDDNSEHKQEES